MAGHHIFGTGDAVPSRRHLLSALNRLRARGGRKVTAALVAGRIDLRRHVEAQDVLDVAATNPTLVDVTGSTVGLTDAGLTAARSRMSPASHLVGD